MTNTTENQLREARAAFENWCARRFPLAECSDDDDRFEAHLWEAWQAALASPEPPAPSGLPAGEVTAREVSRQVFAVCEETEDLTDAESASEKSRDFLRGRRFEAKQIRRAIGTWLTDEENLRATPSPQVAEPAGEPATQAAGEAPVPWGCRMVDMTEGLYVMLAFDKQEQADAYGQAVATMEGLRYGPLAAPQAGAAEARAKDEEIEDLKVELDRVTAERDEALSEPWPAWANQVLKMTRELSGYDGYDDSDGVDIVQEVREAYDELTGQIEKLKADATPASGAGEPVAWVEPGMLKWGGQFMAHGGHQRFTMPLYAHPMDKQEGEPAEAAQEPVAEASSIQSVMFEVYEYAKRMDGVDSLAGKERVERRVSAKEQADRIRRMLSAIASTPPAGTQEAGIFLVATGEVHEGQETYTRHEGSPPPLCDFEGPLYAKETT